MRLASSICLRKGSHLSVDYLGPALSPGARRVLAGIIGGLIAAGCTLRGDEATRAYIRQAAGSGASTSDQLHQLAELHGNGTYASCLQCAKRYELDWVREDNINVAVVDVTPGWHPQHRKLKTPYPGSRHRTAPAMSR